MVVSWSEPGSAVLSSKLPIQAAYRDKSYFPLGLCICCRWAGCSAPGGNSETPKWLTPVPEGKGNGGLSHSVPPMLSQEQTPPFPLRTQWPESVTRPHTTAGGPCNANSSWFPEVSWTGNSQWIALSTTKSLYKAGGEFSFWSFWFSESEWNLETKVDLKTLEGFGRGQSIEKLQMRLSA